jgi:hypothetical protein
MSEKDNQLALPDSSPKQDSCDRTANTVEDNSADFKKQLQELTAQIAEIATRISRIENQGLGKNNSKKRSKGKSGVTVYISKKWRQFIEQWRLSPDEEFRDVLERFLLWVSENLKANRNHQNNLQEGLNS